MYIYPLSGENLLKLLHGLIQWITDWFDPPQLTQFRSTQIRVWFVFWPRP